MAILPEKVMEETAKEVCAVVTVATAVMAQRLSFVKRLPELDRLFAKEV